MKVTLGAQQRHGYFDAKHVPAVFAVTETLAPHVVRPVKVL